MIGPLLAKYKRAKVSLPGGCAIGVRPIDMHLKALTKMGADITISHGYVMAGTQGLKGAQIVFDTPTVGGTENIMMAACLAEGVTIIEGAAKEPEVVDLANALIKMGAHIEGAGQSTITIEGVSSLSGMEYEVIPDRIEVGTFLVAGAITKGELIIRGARTDHVVAVMEKLSEMGVGITQGEDGSIHVNGDVDLQPVQVADVIRDTIRRLGGQIKEREIDLRIDLDSSLPPLALDRDLMEQIMYHLLSNACQASAPAGEVAVAVRYEGEGPGQFEEAADRTGYLFISVRDSGGGVQLADQPYVFDRHYRAEYPSIAGLGETSMGLPLVRELLQAQGGRIWIESEPDMGSTFSMVLPAKVARHSPS